MTTKNNELERKDATAKNDLEDPRRITFGTVSEVDIGPNKIKSRPSDQLQSLNMKIEQNLSYVSQGQTRYDPPFEESDSKAFDSSNFLDQ